LSRTGTFYKAKRKVVAAIAVDPTTAFNVDHVGLNVDVASAVVDGSARRRRRRHKEPPRSLVRNETKETPSPSSR
jgi:hypothetical protein